MWNIIVHTKFQSRNTEKGYDLENIRMDGATVSPKMLNRIGTGFSWLRTRSSLNVF
jgi:hypothetical protein